MEIKELFTRYLDYLKVYRKKGTYNYYKKTFKQLLSVLNQLSINKTSDIAKDTQQKMVVILKETFKKKNSKTNDTISALYSALNKYQIESLIGEQIKLLDDTEPFKALSDYELKKMLRYLKKLDLEVSNNLSWTLAIYILLDTGVRLNELLNIRLSDINRRQKSISLKTTKSGVKRVVFYGKLSSNLVDTAFKKKTEYLIQNYIQDVRLNTRSLYYFFNKMQRHLRLRKKIHPHRLRKTFATKLLLNGCPITTIQKILGHQSLAQTMTYLDISKYVLKKDYDEYYMNY